MPAHRETIFEMLTPFYRRYRFFMIGTYLLVRVILVLFNRHFRQWTPETKRTGDSGSLLGAKGNHNNVKFKGSAKSRKARRNGKQLQLR